MAKRQTLTIIGIVAAVIIVGGVIWGMFGSEIMAAITGEETGGGSNTNTTDEFENKPPVAILNADQTFIREGDVVIFDGNSSYDIDYNGTLSNNGIFFFEYNYRDGSEVERFENGTEVAHIFNDQGEYDVILTVYDEFGAKDNDTVTITVVPRDTLISANQVLIGQAIIPGVGIVPNSTEVNWTIEEGAKRMNLTVTVSGYNLQEMRDNKVEITLFNYYEDIMENRTLEVTGQETISWDYGENDFPVYKEWYILIQCIEGGALVGVEGTVSYVE